MIDYNAEMLKAIEEYDQVADLLRKWSGILREVCADRDELATQVKGLKERIKDQVKVIQTNSAVKQARAARDRALNEVEKLRDVLEVLLTNIEATPTVIETGDARAALGIEEE